MMIGDLISTLTNAVLGTLFILPLQLGVICATYSVWFIVIFFLLRWLLTRSVIHTVLHTYKFILANLHERVTGF